jgi:predicted Zn finger-like uncharacterized protein
MIEVQCTSCHTRYRIDEQVLPEGLPTFKCSRCGHVFTFEPRKPRLDAQSAIGARGPRRATETDGEESNTKARSGVAEESLRGAAGSVTRDESPSAAQNMAADDSDISQPPEAEARPSSRQSQRIENEEAEGPPQPRPAGLGSQRPARDETDPPEATAATPPPVSTQLRAKQAEKFYSQLFTGKSLDAASGENLSFDFADEEPAPDQARLTRRSRRQGPVSQSSESAAARWEVGDDEAISAARAQENAPFEQEFSRSARRRMRVDDAEPQGADDSEFIDEEEAPVYNRAITHSARFFVMLILLIGAGFGVLTVFAHNAPGKSLVLLSYLPSVGDRFVTPITPAKLVALRDVNAFYQHGKEGQNTLVINGTAENVGSESLRVVQLTAALRDGQHRSLASQSVYCGNSVSAGMIGQMTPHEIEFFQKLEPTRNFALEPSANCRFVAVFMNPSSAARAYEVSVSQAVPGLASSVAEPAP